jgi:predicted DNA-binding transcriptional regulator YafY
LTRPHLVGYREASRVFVAWCELREDFRTFRADRVVAVAFLEERYAARPGALRAEWLARVGEEETRSTAPVTASTA